MKSIILGIDPGISGAIAVYDISTKSLRDLFDMPTEFKDKPGGKRLVDGVILALKLDQWRGEILGAVIEDVGARPGQGVTSMFSFGYSTGIVTGVLQGMGMTIHKSAPSVWKLLMGVNATKSYSRIRAKALFPDHEKLFDRAKDDGRAEAALLAKFGERVFKGER